MSGGARPRGRSRAVAAADAATLEHPPRAAEPPPRPDEDDRPVALRLARVHLRMGSLPLARAELESLVGRAMLDDEGLLDLAEVRWRTGDLSGAGEAANVLLARGRKDVLALVIAAEAVSAQGRPGEARRIAGRALEAADGTLDAIFLGMPRSIIWPGEAPAASAAADEPGQPIASHHGGELVHGMTGVAAMDATGSEAGDTPASTGAAEAYAGGRAALGAGDTVQAAVRLGVALRLEPGYAPDVIEAIGDRAATDPGLALVVGDALRLLGRESEAIAAYDRARGHEPADTDAERDADDLEG